MQWQMGWQHRVQGVATISMQGDPWTPRNLQSMWVFREGPGREPENPFLICSVSTQTGKEAPQAVGHSAAVLGGLHCVHWKYTISANQMALRTGQQSSSLHGLQCPFVLIQGLWDVALPHHQVMSQNRKLKGRWAVARSVGSGPSRDFKAFQPFCKM